ncbi:hypothetical protein HYV64_02495 [Candidatus Shapirobacteria bacterium]|nr:hypothetical protein [Candidatus Shapirobacteria bacterium]
MKISNQTKHKVANFLFPQIPEKEIGPAINAKVNETIRPLVIHDTNNDFGSKWGEITARMSADRLGLTVSEVKKQLTTDRPTKAKTEQGIQSGILKRRIRDELQGNGIEIARNIRLDGQIESWKLRAKELGCTNSQADNVVNCLVELVSTQTDFGDMLNMASLVKSLANAACGKRGLDLNILRCPPQRDSETEGISVSPEIWFETTTSSGRKAVVDQEVNFASVQGITKILNKWKIMNSPKVTLVDIDAFVIDSPNREQAVEEFEKKFEPLTSKILPGSKIEKVSRQLGVRSREEFFCLPDVKKIMVHPETVFTEKQVESEVDGIFTRLQERRLPENLKTRESARNLAKKKMALEFVMGKELAGEDNVVFVQRARTPAAADVFLNGAKKSNNKPAFLFFWNERVMED